MSERSPERPNQIHDEPTDVLPFVKQGDLFIGYFIGQTHLYVPNAIVDQLGVGSLDDCISEVYGEERLEKAYLLRPCQRTHSLQFELPPDRDLILELKARIENRLNDYRSADPSDPQ